MAFETVFAGKFRSVGDISREFEILPDALNGAELIFAAYWLGDYEGEAEVYFCRDGSLFEVHGAHCSCYGLEGQWEPTATTLAAIAMRRGHGEASDAIRRFLDWKGVEQ